MPRSSVPEPAIAVGEDPRRYARLMSAVYDATMTGGRAPARPRKVIEDSWRRLMARGIDPGALPAPEVEDSTLDLLRQSSGLLAVLNEITRGLESLVAEGDNILVIADAQGRVLWRSGSRSVLGQADRLGFVEGAHWGENAVGTNAIGTALMSNGAVQVFSAEHYARSHHSWTCAGAPIKDPRTGQVIGVVDVSGPAATVHPTTVALVDAVARLAQAHLREEHDRTLNRLRTVAAPILARIASPALAIDPQGWVAAVDSLPPHNRIAMPREITPGRLWFPTLGACDVDPLPGGWLVRLAPEVAEAHGQVVRATLDLRNPDVPSLQMDGEFGCWRRELSLRHAEIFLALAISPGGRFAPELADDLYGDPSRAVTVRAELSRLRKQYGSLLAAQPYRIAGSVSIDVRYPDDMTALLPSSSAPFVRAARRQHADSVAGPQAPHQGPRE
jgi:hypothetical protein